MLKKPPFRFLHDVISEVTRNTGFAEGLYSDDELNSGNIKDKDSKVSYLTKIINCVGVTLAGEGMECPLPPFPPVPHPPFAIPGSRSHPRLSVEPLAFAPTLSHAHLIIDDRTVSDLRRHHVM